MGQRFENDRVYGVAGDRLNQLQAVVDQLSGLRTLTFNEQRAAANTLRLILTEAAASSRKAAVR